MLVPEIELSLRETFESKALVMLSFASATTRGQAWHYTLWKQPWIPPGLKVQLYPQQDALALLYDLAYWTIE